MTLNEELESTINDPAMLEQLRAGAYGHDNRPCWIGAYRPTTTCEELKGMANWAAAHYNYYLTFVRDFMERRGSVLDIGSGCGQNTAMLARYAERALGVEPESFGHSFAVKNNRTSGAEFYSTEFPTGMVGRGPFDYIFCIETIEHVMYGKQVALIQAALDMLAPDGRMFITTPNETTPSGPHIGVWSPDQCARIRAEFGERIVKWGWFSNLRPGDGFVAKDGTHHAVVLK